MASYFKPGVLSALRFWQQISCSKIRVNTVFCLLSRASLCSAAMREPHSIPCEMETFERKACIECALWYSENDASGLLLWKHRAAAPTSSRLWSKNLLEWDNNPPKWGSCSAVIVSVTTSYFPETFHSASCSNNHNLSAKRPMGGWCVQAVKQVGKPLCWGGFVRCFRVNRAAQKHLIRSTCQFNKGLKGQFTQMTEENLPLSPLMIPDLASYGQFLRSLHSFELQLDTEI